MKKRGRVARAPAEDRDPYSGFAIVDQPRGVRGGGPHPPRGYRDSVELPRFVTAMTLVPPAAARRELIAGGAAADYVHIVPPGIPAAVPAPTAGAAFRERFGLQDRRVVTIFGYIAPNK